MFQTSMNTLKLTPGLVVMDTSALKCSTARCMGCENENGLPLRGHYWRDVGCKSEQHDGVCVRANHKRFSMVPNQDRKSVAHRELL